MELKHIIDPERQGLWIAVGFILALLALVVGLFALQRANEVLVGTQMQVLVLNQKIETLRKDLTPPAVEKKEAMPATQ
ncbi:MAG: hypothetical protein Q8J67_06400 [Rhodocyclaceae bacterium]|nr:hypothetical protein [Rhodocyclaceae bacterium]